MGAQLQEMTEESIAFLNIVNWTKNLFEGLVEIIDMDTQLGTIAMRGETEDVQKARAVLHKLMASVYEKMAERRLY